MDAMDTTAANRLTGERITRMSWPYVLHVMRLRGWIVLATVVLAVAGALVYARAEPRLYQASATTFAYPRDPSGSGSSNPADSVGLLTYGNMADTFASLAQSRYYLHQAGARYGITPQALDPYTVKATTLPQTTVLQISVIGPDPRATALLANQLLRLVAASTVRYFHIFGLQQLDVAAPSSVTVQPHPLQQAFYALVAGLIAGFAIAAVSMRSTRRIGLSNAALSPAEAEAPWALPGAWPASHPGAIEAQHLNGVHANDVHAAEDADTDAEPALAGRS